MNPFKMMRVCKATSGILLRMKYKIVSSCLKLVFHCIFLLCYFSGNVLIILKSRKHLKHFRTPIPNSFSSERENY